MSFTLNAIFSLSIGLTVVIGWMRLRSTGPAFLPFLILATIGFVNELTSISLALKGYSTIINLNLYQLAEALLLTWQFLRWGLFKKNKGLYYSLQIFFVVCWLSETLLLPAEFDSYFIILHSFSVVLMAVFSLNRVVLNESKILWLHPVSLICIGLIAFSTYALLMEAFWTVPIYQQRFFRLKIFEIMVYINLLTNLIFAFAFLCIPMKPQFIMR